MEIEYIDGLFSVCKTENINFDTDYILVKSEKYNQAVNVLREKL